MRAAAPAVLGAVLPTASSPVLAASAEVSPPLSRIPGDCTPNLQHVYEGASVDVRPQPATTAAAILSSPSADEGQQEARNAATTALPLGPAVVEPGRSTLCPPALTSGRTPQAVPPPLPPSPPAYTAPAAATPTPRQPAAEPATWRLQRDGHTLEPCRPFCVEVCAGSGRLTAELRRRGLDAWALDHKGARLAPVTAALLYVDLTLASDVALLRKLLAHPQLVYVHFSPPSDTASTARDRALPGVPGGGPPPLRSADYPLGFPDLKQRLPREWQRVLAANAIYQAVVECIDVLLQRSVAWSIEMPRASYF